MAIPPRPSSSMISYSAARASRTRSVSSRPPVAIAWIGVVAIRSRPQEGQNLDLPVISLPQREQNMRGSYRPAGGSQAEYNMALCETKCRRRRGETRERRGGENLATGVLLFK